MLCPKITMEKDILISKIMSEFYDYIIGPISKQPEIF